MSAQTPDPASNAELIDAALQYLNANEVLSMEDKQYWKDLIPVMDTQQIEQLIQILQEDLTEQSHLHQQFAQSIGELSQQFSQKKNQLVEGIEKQQLKHQEKLEQKKALQQAEELVEKWLEE